MRNTRFCTGILFVCSVFGQGGFNGPGRYEITNIKSGKVIDLDRNDETSVIQFSSRGTDNQTWYIQRADSNFYFIRNGMNGNALTATRSSNASEVQGLPFTGDPSQQWTLENGKDGNALIVNRQGKSLDIPDGTSRDGARVQIFDRNGDSNQRFSFRQVSGEGGGGGGGRFRQPAWLGNQNQGGALITCSSDDGGRHNCNADTRSGVQLTRQISGSACIEGQTWGYDSRGIWVDRGCRAQFQAGSSGSRAAEGGGGGTIVCSSDDGKRRYCNADTRGNVRLTRQISGSACVQGQTWGYDDRGIWVDRGCRAEFQVDNNGRRR